jgi:hypothetical protein
VNEYDNFSPLEIVPLILLLRMTTPEVNNRRSQFTTFESMILDAFGVESVIVHGPVYAVNAVPAGTPVLPGPGQQPPDPFGPPGTCDLATAHRTPDGTSTDGDTLTEGDTAGDGDTSGDADPDPLADGTADTDTDGVGRPFAAWRAASPVAVSARLSVTAPATSAKAATVSATGVLTRRTTMRVPSSARSRRSGPAQASR